LDSLENNFSKIRAGRAHPSLLEQIQVEYYGSMVPLSQVGNIVAEDSHTDNIQKITDDHVKSIDDKLNQKENSLLEI